MMLLGEAFRSDDLTGVDKQQQQGGIVATTWNNLLDIKGKDLVQISNGVRSMKLYVTTDDYIFDNRWTDRMIKQKTKV